MKQLKFSKFSTETIKLKVKVKLHVMFTCFCSLGKKLVDVNVEIATYSSVNAVLAFKTPPLAMTALYSETDVTIRVHSNHYYSAEY